MTILQIIIISDETILCFQEYNFVSVSHFDLNTLIFFNTTLITITKALSSSYFFVSVNGKLYFAFFTKHL